MTALSRSGDVLDIELKFSTEASVSTNDCLFYLDGKTSNIRVEVQKLQLSTLLIDYQFVTKYSFASLPKRQAVHAVRQI